LAAAAVGPKLSARITVREPLQQRLQQRKPLQRGTLQPQILSIRSPVDRRAFLNRPSTSAWTTKLLRRSDLFRVTSKTQSPQTSAPVPNAGIENTDGNCGWVRWAARFAGISQTARTRIRMR